LGPVGLKPELRQGRSEFIYKIDIPTQQPWLFPSCEYFTLKEFVKRKLEIPNIPLKNYSNDPGLHTDLPIPLGAPMLAGTLSHPNETHCISRRRSKINFFRALNCHTNCSQNLYRVSSFSSISP